MMELFYSAYHRHFKHFYEVFLKCCDQPEQAIKEDNDTSGLSALSNYLIEVIAVHGTLIRNSRR